MPSLITTKINKRSARAILVDDEGCLLLIRRIKKNESTYWTTPGGGVEEYDASVSAALKRELAEELGATVSEPTSVFLFSSTAGDGLSLQYLFLARLLEIDDSKRNGEEFLDISRGDYVIERVSLLGNDLEKIDLKPSEFKEFILLNRLALLAEACGESVYQHQ